MQILAVGSQTESQVFRPDHRSFAVQVLPAQQLTVTLVFPGLLGSGFVHEEGPYGSDSSLQAVQISVLARTSQHYMAIERGDSGVAANSKAG